LAIIIVYANLAVRLALEAITVVFKPSFSAIRHAKGFSVFFLQEVASVAKKASNLVNIAGHAVII
jgi:hypothetical protein